MTKKSMGAIAVMALLIGLTGFSMTGCGVGTVPVVGPADSVDFDPKAESVVPIDQSGIALEVPES
ncbi:MAG: hypothetical protein ACC682_14100 [Gemmatimonadota bacterium]